MLHMLGMVAQSGEMFSAEHVADAEVGFEGDGEDEGFASDAREVADGVGWAIEMLEDLEAGDDVEAGVGEGKLEHTGADATGRGVGEDGFVAEIEADGAEAGRQDAAAQQFAFAAAGV